jgi:hypothetical protein
MSNIRLGIWDYQAVNWRMAITLDKRSLAFCFLYKKNGIPSISFNFAEINNVKGVSSVCLFHHDIHIRNNQGLRQVSSTQVYPAGFFDKT